MLPVSLGAALNVVYFPQLGYLITLPKYHLQHRSSNLTGKNADDNSSVDTELHQQYLAGFQLQVKSLFSKMFVLSIGLTSGLVYYS